MPTWRRSLTYFLVTLVNMIIQLEMLTKLVTVNRQMLTDLDREITIDNRQIVIPSDIEVLPIAKTKVI
jgi:hypothetical protein